MVSKQRGRGVYILRKLDKLKGMSAAQLREIYAEAMAYAYVVKGYLENQETLEDVNYATAVAETDKWIARCKEIND